MRILVAEDDVKLGEFVRNALVEEGNAVDLAHDGERAWLLAGTEGYDVLILDIMLPKLDGIEILNKLEKEKKIHLNKKIVLLTNLSEEALAEQEKKIKDFEYLIKSSINPGQLLAKISKYLN